MIMHQSARICVVLSLFCAEMPSNASLAGTKESMRVRPEAEKSVTRKAEQNRCTNETATSRLGSRDHILTLEKGSDSCRSSNKQSTLAMYLPNIRCFSSCDRIFLLWTLFELSVLPRLSNAPFRVGGGASGSK